MARPRKIGDSMRQFIRHIGAMRRQLPTDKELATKAGCSMSAVQAIMREQLLALSSISIDRDAEDNAACLPNENVASLSANSCSAL